MSFHGCGRMRISKYALFGSSSVRSVCIRNTQRNQIDNRGSECDYGPIRLLANEADASKTAAMTTWTRGTEVRRVHEAEWGPTPLSGCNELPGASSSPSRTHGQASLSRPPKHHRMRAIDATRSGSVDFAARTQVPTRRRITAHMPTSPSANKGSVCGDGMV